MILKSSLLRLLPDKMFLKLIFRHIFGYNLDLKNPQTFNEKLQRLKFYEHYPKYTTL